MRKIICWLCYIMLFNLSMPFVHADIDETEIIGFYDSFKEEYKYLSPVYGFLALKSNILSKVRFYGNYGQETQEFLCHKQITHPPLNIDSAADRDCPKSNTTAILQHLFPSPVRGILSISSAQSDFFFNLSIEQIGMILDAYVSRDKKNINDRLKSIKNTMGKSALSRISNGWKHYVKKNAADKLVDDYINMLIGSQKEVVNYPPHLVEHALLAFAIKKAQRASDLEPLVRQLQQYQKSDSTNRQNFTKADYDNFKKKSVGHDHKVAIDEFTHLLNDPKRLIFYTIAFDKYDQPFPHMVGTNLANFEEVYNFSDCGESFLRNFFNLMAMDIKDREFHGDYITEKFRNVSPKLIDFYNNYQRSFDDINAPGMPTIWAQVVSALNDGHEPTVDYAFNGKCNIKGNGIDNILAALEKLLDDDQIAKLRVKYDNDVVKKRGETINYLFEKLSRADLVFDWQTTKGNKIITNGFDSINVIINGEKRFVWEFNSIHYGVEPVTKQDITTDWRKNDPRVLRAIIDLPESLAIILLPFYVSNYNIKKLILRNHAKIPHTLSETVIYSLDFSDAESILESLYNSAAINAQFTLLPQWLEPFVGNAAIDKKIVITLHKLSKHLSDWHLV